MPTKMHSDLYPDKDSADRLRAIFRDSELALSRGSARRIRGALTPFVVSDERLAGLADDAIVLVSTTVSQLRELREAFAALEALDALAKING